MFPCQRYLDQPISRRALLSQAAHGFGAVALSTMLPHTSSSVMAASPSGNSLAAQPTHFPAKAKQIIFLYMDGGPSQVDTFDPKPMLDRYDGRAPHEVIGKVEPTQFASIGKILKSPWKFRQYGESGIPVSDLFPHIGSCADDLAVVRSMVAPFSEHTFANYFLHTGHGQQGRPSHGAWVSYGLGSECDDLPAFVILNGGLIPPGGMDCFGSGFLPAAYQGSVFTSGEAPVANIRPTEKSRELQEAKLALMRRVRFIEITCPSGNGDRWDQHAGLVDGHTKNARSVDKPIAALIQDLKQRGLLDETLIVWCGEFGRTPFAQGGDGRDHNPFGFTIWMAGGGTKGGTIHGATDDFGYRSVENKVEVHDLHATMLHLLGVDHTRQTFRFGGRDMRLTDVHGHVVHEILS